MFHEDMEFGIHRFLNKTCSQLRNQIIVNTMHVLILLLRAPSAVLRQIRNAFRSSFFKLELARPFYARHFVCDRNQMGSKKEKGRRPLHLLDAILIIAQITQTLPHHET